jgi:acetolactate synthase-1/2/3 large subunit
MAQKMKLTDYLIDYLVGRKSRHAFGMSGGAAVHMFDSASKHPGMGLTCVQHEQSAAMAADGYSRLSGNLGVSIVTSGPGATNLLSGVCCSYYDSVPSLMLTGQVATHRLKGDRKVRQVGFQETDVLSIFSSVTKYGYQLRDPANIAFALDAAYCEAESGRPGPVLLDIPDDLQRADVDPQSMRRFTPESGREPSAELRQIEALLELVYKAQRPVFVLGGGFSTPRVGSNLQELLRKIPAPVLQTWAGLDLIPYEWPHRYGTFGVYGPRLGNFIVQNADLIVCLGTRLSQNLTGGMLKSFATKAKIAMVDVDQGEMDKFDGRGIDVSVRVQSKVGEFVDVALAAVGDRKSPDYSPWIRIIENWKTSLPNDIPEPPPDSSKHVDANHFVQVLSEHLADDEAIFVDTGGNLTWTCNNLRVKKDQRVMSAWNFTPMGYALPAAIGGAAFDRSRPITCIIGDGGLSLCLGELVTLIRYNYPVKVILFNNHCHGIQRQTLETWLDSRYVGVDPASGLSFPDFVKVAKAMDFPVVTIDQSSGISGGLKKFYAIPGPAFCNVEINPDQKLLPVLKFGHSLEDQMPLIPRDQLQRLLSI